VVSGMGSSSGTRCSEDSPVLGFQICHMSEALVWKTDHTWRQREVTPKQMLHQKIIFLLFFLVVGEICHHISSSSEDRCCKVQYMFRVHMNIYSPKVHVLAGTLVPIVLINTWWFGG